MRASTWWGQRHRRAPDLAAHVAELEEQLDHERLYPVEWANRRVRDRFGDTVQAGPFAGTVLPEWGSTGIDLFSPKLLGIYERELHPALEEAIARRPPLVVVIGAAEGYYVAGLGRRLPEAALVAFEPRADKAELAVEVASLNSVTVEMRAEFCSAASLADVMRGSTRSLIVCDCEGPEGDILDPTVAPELATADVIVEAHDMLVEGVTERLERAFATTHEIERVSTAPRYIEDFPQTDFMPHVTRQLAISEFRGVPMWWLVLRPLRPGAG
jgi:hypothetical protein